MFIRECSWNCYRLRVAVILSDVFEPFTSRCVWCRRGEADPGRARILRPRDLTPDPQPSCRCPSWSYFSRWVGCNTGGLEYRSRQLGWWDCQEQQEFEQEFAPPVPRFLDWSFPCFPWILHIRVPCYQKCCVHDCKPASPRPPTPKLRQLIGISLWIPIQHSRLPFNDPLDRSNIFLLPLVSILIYSQ
jgi:hypothetical protein